MHRLALGAILIAATSLLTAPLVRADPPAAAAPVVARWASDGPLRAAIDELAQMLRAVGHDLRQNQRTEAQYDALADWLFDRRPAADLLLPPPAGTLVAELKPREARD